MKLLINLLLMVALIITTFQCHAGAGWSGKATVSSIYAMNENAAIVKLSNFSNPQGCNIQASGDVFINPTTQKTWFTLLLSAYMAGKSVDIYVTASCQSYWANTDFAVIGHVRLLD
jgi:hypothetical protein